MSAIGNILAVAALATTSAAFAGPSHLTDAQYIAAARCQGLFNSQALGATDSSGIDKVMKSESTIRDQNVFQLGQDARDSASREARFAGVQGRSALVSERDGACKVYTHAGGVGDHAAN